MSRADCLSDMILVEVAVMSFNFAEIRKNLPWGIEY